MRRTLHGVTGSLLGAGLLVVPSLAVAATTLDGTPGDDSLTGTVAADVIRAGPRRRGGRGGPRLARRRGR